MGYYNIILIVNATSILVLLILALLLLISTKFKGANAYAAAIIVFTTIPVYVYNLCRAMEWYSVAQYIAPFAFSLNAMLMPLLWLFVRSNFVKNFKLTPIRSLHFLPAIFLFVVYFIIFFSVPVEHRLDWMIQEKAGADTLLGNINSAVVFTQVFVYFILIFLYLYSIKKLIVDNYSQAQWVSKLWIWRFMILVFSLFLIVFVCYLVAPRTDEWLFQILNMIAMIYLAYNSMKGAQNKSTLELPMEMEEKDSILGEDLDTLADYATQIIDYLTDTEAYLNPNLTLYDVSSAMSVSPKKLSKAINHILHKNFFQVVNGFRVEKAKKLLPHYKDDNVTLETIAEQCGFNSAIVFSNVFKKAVGETPAKWTGSRYQS